MSSVCPRSGRVSNGRSKYHWLRWLWPVSGLACLVWFLIRVIPKPSRAVYPCQRIAFPLASSFIAWLLGLWGSVVVGRKARNFFSLSRYLSGLLCVIVGVGCIWLCLTFNADKQVKAAGSSPANSPIGVAKGIHPGRVAWVHDPNATNWNGPGTGDGYWWQSNHTNQRVINLMMHRAICTLAGGSDISKAWDALIRYFNQEHDKGDVGYTSGEKIMIKVNFVDMIAVFGVYDYNFISISHYPEYAICSPQIMYALLDQLINVVGVSQSDITIGDPTCLWCNEFYNMIHPDFPNVHYLDYLGWYNRTQAVKSTVPFYWSTTHANGKTQDYVGQSYVSAEYLINLASLKGHYGVAGVTLCGKNHYGSLRGPTTTGYYDMHSDAPFFTPEPQNGRYRPMVDLMGHHDVGGKTLLCLIDGLYGGKHAKAYPGNLPLKWQMPPFNNDWPSSIFASQDQVAADSVGFDFLVTEWPDADGPAHAGTDDYLHEAAQANDPCSKTFYDPEHDGTRLTSLGVHEHWNSSTNKQYTRNLGTGSGIELVKVPQTQDADFDGDGDVDWDDLMILASQWLMPPGIPSADIAPKPDGDGVVNFLDFSAFAEHWLDGI